MECVCLGEVHEQEADEHVECLNLKHPRSYEYDRNYEFFKGLNLGQLYVFLSSVASSLRLNYLSTARPTKLQHDSSARQVLSTFRSMFCPKRRKLTFDLHGAGCRSYDAPFYLASNFDFFVDERHLTVVSAHGGSNLRVTTMSTDSEFALTTKARNGAEAGFEVMESVPTRSFVVVTGKESLLTTLSVNDFFGFGFEVFAGFADSSVAFFRVNTNLGLLKGTEEDACSCANLTGFLYLDEVPTSSRFSPNRELVLVGTPTALYLLEKGGFEVEYEKLCEFKRHTLLCADFLNDFEVMVLESNFILTVYKKSHLKYEVYIRYNLLSILSVPAESRPPHSHNRNLGGAPSERTGKLVRDYRGNVYLMVRNMDLVKLTWNETLIPYSSTVSLQPPSNFNNLNSDNHKGLQRLLYNFNVENNLLAATFAGSNRVHLYSLSSFKELDQLRPPKADYLPKYVASGSSSNCCFLLVLWTHTSHFNHALDEDYRQVYERDLHHPDVLRTYKLKSSLTKSVAAESQYVPCPSGYEPGFRPQANGAPLDYVPSRYKKLPLLSSLHPRVKNPLQTRFNDFGKFEEAFGSRRHLFGRSLSDHSLRLPHETIYSIDEFIRNRRR